MKWPHHLCLSEDPVPTVTASHDRAQSCNAQPECRTSCSLALPSHLAHRDRDPQSVRLLPPWAMQLEGLPQWGGEVGLLAEEFEASEMQLDMAPAASPHLWSSSPVAVSSPEEAGAFELQLEEAPATAPYHRPGPPVATSTPTQSWENRIVAASVGT